VKNKVRIHLNDCVVVLSWKIRFFIFNP
jgi:hypothetical protein